MERLGTNESDNPLGKSVERKNSKGELSEVPKKSTELQEHSILPGGEKKTAHDEKNPKELVNGSENNSTSNEKKNYELVEVKKEKDCEDPKKLEECKKHSSLPERAKQNMLVDDFDRTSTNEKVSGKFDSANSEKKENSEKNLVEEKDSEEDAWMIGSYFKQLFHNYKYSIGVHEKHKFVKYLESLANILDDDVFANKELPKLPGLNNSDKYISDKLEKKGTVNIMEEKEKLKKNSLELDKTKSNSNTQELLKRGKINHVSLVDGKELPSSLELTNSDKTLSGKQGEKIVKIKTEKETLEKNSDNSEKSKKQKKDLNLLEPEKGKSHDNSSGNMKLQDSLVLVNPDNRGLNKEKETAKIMAERKLVQVNSNDSPQSNYKNNLDMLGTEKRKIDYVNSTNQKVPSVLELANSGENVSESREQVNEEKKTLEKDSHDFQKVKNNGIDLPERENKKTHDDSLVNEKPSNSLELANSGEKISGSREQGKIVQVKAEKETSKKVSQESKKNEIECNLPGGENKKIHEGSLVSKKILELANSCGNISKSQEQDKETSRKDSHDSQKSRQNGIESDLPGKENKKTRDNILETEKVPESLGSIKPHEDNSGEKEMEQVVKIKEEKDSDVSEKLKKQREHLHPQKPEKGKLQDDSLRNGKLPEPLAFVDSHKNDSEKRKEENNVQIKKEKDSDDSQKLKKRGGLLNPPMNLEDNLGNKEKNIQIKMEKDAEKEKTRRLREYFRQLDDNLDCSLTNEKIPESSGLTNLHGGNLNKMKTGQIVGVKEEKEKAKTHSQDSKKSTEGKDLSSLPERGKEKSHNDGLSCSDENDLEKKRKLLEVEKEKNFLGNISHQSQKPEKGKKKSQGEKIQTELGITNLSESNSQIQETEKISDNSEKSQDPSIPPEKGKKKSLDDNFNCLSTEEKQPEPIIFSSSAQNHLEKKDEGIKKKKKLLESNSDDLGKPLMKSHEKEIDRSSVKESVEKTDFEENNEDEAVKTKKKKKKKSLEKTVDISREKNNEDENVEPKKKNKKKKKSSEKDFDFAQDLDKGKENSNAVELGENGKILESTELEECKKKDSNESGKDVEVRKERKRSKKHPDGSEKSKKKKRKLVDDINEISEPLVLENSVKIQERNENFNENSVDSKKPKKDKSHSISLGREEKKFDNGNSDILSTSGNLPELVELADLDSGEKSTEKTVRVKKKKKSLERDAEDSPKSKKRKKNLDTPEPEIKSLDNKSDCSHGNKKNPELSELADSREDDVGKNEEDGIVEVKKKKKKKKEKSFEKEVVVSQKSGKRKKKLYDDTLEKTSEELELANSGENNSRVEEEEEIIGAKKGDETLNENPDDLKKLKKKKKKKSHQDSSSSLSIEKLPELVELTDSDENDLADEEKDKSVKVKKKKKKKSLDKDAGSLKNQEEEEIVEINEEDESLRKNSDGSKKSKKKKRSHENLDCSSVNKKLPECVELEDSDHDDLEGEKSDKSETVKKKKKKKKTSEKEADNSRKSKKHRKKSGDSEENDLHGDSFDPSTRKENLPEVVELEDSDEDGSGGKSLKKTDKIKKKNESMGGEDADDSKKSKKRKKKSHANEEISEAGEENVTIVEKEKIIETKEGDETVEENADSSKERKKKKKKKSRHESSDCSLVTEQLPELIELPDSDGEVPEKEEKEKSAKVKKRKKSSENDTEDTQKTKKRKKHSIDFELEKGITNVNNDYDFSKKLEEAESNLSSSSTRKEKKSHEKLPEYVELTDSDSEKKKKQKVKLKKSKKSSKKDVDDPQESEKRMESLKLLEPQEKKSSDDNSDCSGSKKGDSEKSEKTKRKKLLEKSSSASRKSKKHKKNMQDEANEKESEDPGLTNSCDDNLEIQEKEKHVDVEERQETFKENSDDPPKKKKKKKAHNDTLDCSSTNEKIPELIELAESDEADSEEKDKNETTKVRKKKKKKKEKSLDQDDEGSRKSKEHREKSDTLESVEKNLHDDSFNRSSTNENLPELVELADSDQDDSGMIEKSLEKNSDDSERLKKRKTTSDKDESGRKEKEQTVNVEKNSNDGEAQKKFEGSFSSLEGKKALNKNSDDSIKPKKPKSQLNSSLQKEKESNDDILKNKKLPNWLGLSDSDENDSEKEEKKKIVIMKEPKVYENSDEEEAQRFEEYFKHLEGGIDSDDCRKHKVPEKMNKENQTPNKNPKKKMIHILPKKAESDENEEPFEVVESKTITEDEAMALRNMEIKLNHVVPPQHQVESRAGGMSLLPIERIEFEKYVKLRSGTFHPEEDKRINRNWKEFCELNGWNQKIVEPFLKWRHSGLYYIPSLMERKKFVQFLAKDLNDRSLYSVLHRFVLLYSKCKTTRYSPAEDQFILDFIRENPFVPDKFARIGEKLRRTRPSVWRRYRIICRDIGITPGRLNATL